MKSQMNYFHEEKKKKKITPRLNMVNGVNRGVDLRTVIEVVVLVISKQNGILEHQHYLC